MSVEKNQLFKVGDRVKILPTIRAYYPDFPYVGVVGRVCAIEGYGNQIGVEFSTPHNYLHNCNGAAKQDSGWWCYRKHLKFIPDDNLPDIWEYIK
jgi:hypothetical protein